MILVTGASGQLGTAFRKRLGDRAEYLDRSLLDLSEPDAAGTTVRALRPDTVINCAAYTAVDRAQDEEDIALAVNATAVGEMAAACHDIGARFVTYSTDYVFDGTKPGSYVESDPTTPINAYGRTKLEGEQMALAVNADSLVIRTSWVMSGTHRNFAAVMLELIAKGDVTVVADQHGRPTLVDDLVVGTMRALDAGVTGILHMANAGTTSWYELARTIADIAGLDPHRVAPCTTADYPTKAARPLNSVLDSERIAALGLAPLPDFHGALEAAVHELLAS
ncbi:MAG: dTDP-4-dehydrorhamnose reductase [Actinomycetia bacterium]|nr:dTDP-4-dehydrorhamnose reductase [Actinomycetes bacterium]